MPKQNVNYQNAVIYKIVPKDINLKDCCYVGSTTSFLKRKSLHKNNSKTVQRKIYNFIRINGGFDNFEMIEIEKFPCENKIKSSKREKYYIDLLQANLNHNLHNRNNEEWRKDNPNYMNNYFQNKLKQKIKHCDCCNKDLKYMSWINHIRGNLHKTNMDKIDTLP